MDKNELQKTYQEIILKTNGGVDDYVVALCRIGNAIGELDDPQQEIIDLQHRLDVAEKALELLSKSNISNVMEEERQPLIDYIKELAEKELRG